MTIADLQFFFEMTNLIMYQREFNAYGEVYRWWERMLQVKEVNAIQ